MRLFWIQDKEGKMMRFEPNWAQVSLLKDAHNRILVLKARQLGISTYVTMRNLRKCLIIRNYKCAVIDKTLEDAKEKIEKMGFAFAHLDYIPPDPTPLDLELAQVGKMLKEFHTPLGAKKPPAPTKGGWFRFPVLNSYVRACVTYRGNTIQGLHVSELGHISVVEPKRSREIITGSFPCVSTSGEIITESTHEGGKSGVHYEQILAAMSNIGKPLAPTDFQFKFFPWFEHPDYVLHGVDLHETEEDKRYFASIEKQCGVTLSPERRAWYISTRKTQGSLMKQEYPSTPEEAMNPISDGAIYFKELMSLRERGDLEREFQPDPHRPIFTAWDLGVSDFTSIWWIQPTNQGRWLILDNYTANQMPVSHYLNVLREHDARPGWSRCTMCFLPHDGSHHDFGMTKYSDIVRRAGYNVTQVPATNERWLSIDHTRDLLRTCVIHARCSESTLLGTQRYPSGVGALSLYRKADNGLMPLHDENSHAADALRTFADAVSRGLVPTNSGWDESARAMRARRNDRADIEDFLS